MPRRALPTPTWKTIIASITASSPGAPRRRSLRSRHGGPGPPARSVLGRAMASGVRRRAIGRCRRPDEDDPEAAPHQGAEHDRPSTAITHMPHRRPSVPWSATGGFPYSGQSGWARELRASSPDGSPDRKSVRSARTASGAAAGLSPLCPPIARLFDAFPETHGIGAVGVIDHVGDLGDRVHRHMDDAWLAEQATLDRRHLSGTGESLDVQPHVHAPSAAHIAIRLASDRARAPSRVAWHADRSTVPFVHSC